MVGAAGDAGQPAASATAVERWHERVTWWLVGASLVFLAAFSFMVLQPQSRFNDLAEVLVQATWLVFVVDYIARLVLARPRWRWFVRHLHDLALVALPMVWGLRLLRLVTLVSVLQRSAGTKLRGHVVTYAFGGVVLLVYVSALAMLQVERDHPDAGITTFGDAVWWSIATVTTVGYGDLSPRTPEGRVIAVALMLGGIALVGAVTASLASWMLQQVAEQDEAAQAATRAQVRELAALVAGLRAEVAALEVRGQRGAADVAGVAGVAGSADRPPTDR